MRFVVHDAEPYARDGKTGKPVPNIGIYGVLKEPIFSDPLLGQFMVCHMVALPPRGDGQPDDIDRTRQYAQCMAEALQREFGTAEPIAEAAPTFAGIPIPPALEEIRPLLQRAERTEPIKRTPAMVDAIARFCQWCDAEGISMQRAEEPISNADFSRDVVNEARDKLWEKPQAARAKVGPAKGPGDE